jgi:hypothetical protein
MTYNRNTLTFCYFKCKNHFTDFVNNFFNQKTDVTCVIFFAAIIEGDLMRDK